VTDRPARSDARRNREKVLGAARDAFAASGFAVPLDDIAARAGVGPGTVYRHFPTKEALFAAVVAERIESLVADARARAGPGSPDAGAAFVGFLDRLGEEAAVKRDLPDAIAVPGALRDELHAALEVLLRRAQQAGALRGDVTTADLIALLKGVLAATHDDGGSGVGPARANLAFAVLSDGLRPRWSPGVNDGRGTAAAGAEGEGAQQQQGDGHHDTP
jgi:AcrR family transcriptional regulator